MGFVDGEEVDLIDAFQQAGQGRIGGDRHPALATPLSELVITVKPMHDDGVEFCVLTDFALPIDEHAVRRHDEEALLALRGQVAHRGEDLDGLAEAHIIPEQDPLLVDDVLGAELLVATQVGRHQAQVDRRCFDRISNRRRQATAHVGPCEYALGHHLRRQDAFQQRNEGRRVIRIALPDGRRVKGQALCVVSQALGLGLHPSQILLNSLGRVGEFLAGRPGKELLADPRLGPQGHQALIRILETDVRLLRAWRQFADQSFVTGQRQQEAIIRDPTVIRIRQQARVRAG